MRRGQHLGQKRVAFDNGSPVAFGNGWRNDGGKICSIVTSLLAAHSGYYSTYGGQKAPVEHFTRAASNEFGGLTQVEDIAPLVRFLDTEGWRITGQTIFANGGYIDPAVPKAFDEQRVAPKPDL